MPAEYEKIRDNLVSSGKSLKAAKSEAAAIYNSRHKNNPVSRYSDSTSKGRVTRNSDKKVRKGNQRGR